MKERGAFGLRVLSCDESALSAQKVSSLILAHPCEDDVAVGIPKKMDGTPGVGSVHPPVGTKEVDGSARVNAVQDAVIPEAIRQKARRYLSNIAVPVPGSTVRQRNGRHVLRQIISPAIFTLLDLTLRHVDKGRVTPLKWTSSYIHIVSGIRITKADMGAGRAS